MNTQEYSQAAVEVLDIIDNTNKNDVNKIPSTFIQFLVDISDMNYKVKFNHSETIKNLKMKDKTQEILGYIYINWWSKKEEQEIYMKKIKEMNIKKQEELNKKYDPNNIFKNKNSKIHANISNGNEKLQLIEYKENLFKNIIRKIINFFKK